MDSNLSSHTNKNKNSNRIKDPELEAEIVYAKENGYEPPKSLPSDTVKKLTEALVDYHPDKAIFKNLKGCRSERKARSRGVSGCSVKKDGGKFEYGLDCIDLAYNYDSRSSPDTDSEAEYDEFADYVVKYSDNEIRQIVKEYLLNGDIKESMESLQKFRITTDTMSRTTKEIIIMSIEDEANGGLELCVKILSEIVRQKWISLSILAEIVEDIVNSITDLKKDCPKVNDTVSVLIAKLIEYDLFSSNVVKLLAAKNSETHETSRKCYDGALSLISNRYLLQGQCMPCGGHQTLDVLSTQFKLIIKEFLQSNDKETASKRLTQLKVPHFNHEFVYQAGILALEDMNDKTMVQLASLLSDMCENGLISDSCIQKGYSRLFDGLSDLFIDLPAAYALAYRWVDKSLKAGFITDNLAGNCPRVRARTRTLSQGPNGKLSCIDDEIPANTSQNGDVAKIDAKIENGAINDHESPPQRGQIV